MHHFIDAIALEATRQIEDEFVKGHAGGVVQRNAAVQLIVINAIKRAIDDISEICRVREP